MVKSVTLDPDQLDLVREAVRLLKISCILNACNNGRLATTNGWAVFEQVSYQLKLARVCELEAKLQ